MFTRNMFGVVRVALIVVALALVGCNDNQNIPASPGAVPDEQLGVPPEVMNEINELRQIAAAPDGGLAYWMSNTDAPPVELPAGSVDGLAAAIAAAGNNGMVIVKSGLHTESGMVTVIHKVRIIGEPGAVIVFGISPGPGAVLLPAIWVLNANHVTIWGLEIRPVGAAGGTAILLENSSHATVANNVLRDQEVGVFVQRSNHATIWGNRITCVATLDLPMGIIVCNGKHALVASNDVSGGVFGIWACDERGVAIGNSVHGNFVGLILCKVPVAWTLPGGAVVGSDLPAARWLAVDNSATGNSWGYLIIDGANRNHVANNAASASGTYDVEFTADSFRFGFLTPASYNNTFVAGSSPTIVVKNCGNNNRIIGGVLVDNTVDPCF
jgi:hypothetical protein